MDATRSTKDRAPALARSQGKRFIEYALVLRVQESSLFQKISDASLTPYTRLYPVDITDRFPKTNYSDHALEGDYQYFCFPNGAKIAAKQLQTSIHSFVQTKQDGMRIYGFCFIKYNRVSAEGCASIKSQIGACIMSGKMKEESVPLEFFIPECLCLISAQPLFMTYNKILRQLRSLIENRGKSLDEQLLQKIFHEVSSLPLPSSRYASDNLPFIDINFTYIFSHLDPQNMILLFNALLCEQKVIILAPLAHLTESIEALVSLLYPLVWPHVYIPLLPTSLADYIESPVPYIIGFDKSSPGWESVSPSHECIVVDIECNVINATGHNLFKLPPTQRSFLYECVKRFAVSCLYPELPQDKSRDDTTSLSASEEEPEVVEKKPEDNEDFKMEYSEELGWHLVSNSADSLTPRNKVSDEALLWNNLPKDPLTQLRAGFLKTVVSMLKHYRNHVIVPEVLKEEDKEIEIFNNKTFLADVQHSALNFMSKFVDSQLFTYFVQDRIIRQEPDLFDKIVTEILKKEKAKLTKYIGEQYSRELLCSKSEGDENATKSWKKKIVSIEKEDLILEIADLNGQALPAEIEISTKSKIEVPFDIRNAPTPFMFNLKNPDESMVFCADSATTKRKWIRHIKSRILEAQNIPLIPEVEQEQALEEQEDEGQKNSTGPKRSMMFARISKGLKQRRETTSSQKILRQPIKRPTTILITPNTENDKKGSLAQLINSRRDTNSFQKMDSFMTTTKDPSYLEKIRAASLVTHKSIETTMEQLNQFRMKASLEQAFFVGQVLRVMNSVMEASRSEDLQIQLPEKPAKPKLDSKQNEAASAKLQALKNILGQTLDDAKVFAKKLLAEIEQVETVTDAVNISKRLSTILKLLNYALEVESNSESNTNKWDDAGPESPLLSSSTRPIMKTSVVSPPPSPSFKQSPYNDSTKRISSENIKNAKQTDTVQISNVQPLQETHLETSFVQLIPAEIQTETVELIPVIEEVQTESIMLIPAEEDSTQELEEVQTLKEVEVDDLPDHVLTEVEAPTVKSEMVELLKPDRTLSVVSNNSDGSRLSTGSVIIRDVSNAESKEYASLFRSLSVDSMDDLESDGGKEEKTEQDPTNLSEGEAAKKNIRNMYKNDEALLSAFRAKYDFIPTFKAIQFAKDSASASDDSNELIFYAKLAKILKRLLKSPDGDRENINDMICSRTKVVNVHKNTPQVIEMKMELKKATLKALISVDRAVQIIKTEFDNTRDVKRAVFIAKLARNIAKICSDSCTSSPISK